VYQVVLAWNGSGVWSYAIAGPTYSIDGFDEALSREYIEHTKRFEYSSRFEVRRTNFSGRFKFKGRMWEAGGALSEDSNSLAPAENEKT
jgi:hypothetical protein